MLACLRYEIFFEKLAPRVRDGQIITLKSTVPSGVTGTLANGYFGYRENVFIGFSPERLAEGNAIHELKTLPIVVGGVNSESTRKCAEFWIKMLDEIVNDALLRGDNLLIATGLIQTIYPKAEFYYRLKDPESFLSIFKYAICSGST